MSKFDDALKLTIALRTICELPDLFNGHTTEAHQTVMCFLASLSEGIPVPMGTLSYFQRHNITGNLLYSLRWVDVENDDGAQSELPDALRSVAEGLIVLEELIKKDKSKYVEIDDKSP